MTEVILDISRLISRVRYSTPSGVDRVEMAYARGLVKIYGRSLAFAAVHPTGLYGRLSSDIALDYLDELERRWNQEHARTKRRSLPSVIPWMIRLLPRGIPANEQPTSRIYIQVSPHHLVQSAKVGAILAREQAKFLCMVHDLIPIEFPEYARPSGARLHRRRMETIATHADAVIVNSAATGRAFQSWADGNARAISIVIALLGTEQLAEAAPEPDSEDSRPYFVCLGTIEPRKNHLLLLHLWRDMAEKLPDGQVPRLVIIGKRGWENEQVLDMLERCPALKPHVEEINGCSDARMAALLRGARALLMPSFAEGFGMPVAEALSVGLPVLCSDIPAHREVGGLAPDYLDPLDGPAWKTLILDFAKRGAAHQAQIERISAWNAPGWDDHLKLVTDTIARLAQERNFRSGASAR